MRPAMALVAIAGLAVAVVAVMALRDQAGRAPPQVRDRSAVGEATIEGPALHQSAIDPPAADQPAGPAVSAPPPPPSRARPVAPAIIAPPPVPDELQRIGPRAPLGDFGAPLVRKRDPVTLLYRPVAETAGRIVAGDVTVTLAGIEPLGVEETCRDGGGRDWACGIRARTALRALLRGRAISCDLPPEMEVRQATVACRLGTVDLGQWLVEQGWAHAAAGGPYAAAEAAARAARRGIHGDAARIGPPAEPDMGMNGG